MQIVYVRMCAYMHVFVDKQNSMQTDSNANKESVTSLSLYFAQHSLYIWLCISKRIIFPSLISPTNESRK